MGKKAEDVYADALALSDEEQEKLRELLEARCGGGFASPEIEQAWIKEIERRVAAMDRGEAKLVPAADVFQRLEERFSK